MWSVRRLAKASGISESSIRRIESGFGVPENVTLDLLVRLREFYEGKGFVFIWNDDAPGVQWRKKERRRGPPDRRGSGGGPVEAARVDNAGVPVAWQT
jgi:transcriptional regulator with XRE-family HTH domain